MATFKLLLAEIRYRKLNFVLSLFAVAVAVTLFVAGPMLVEAFQEETRVQVAELDRQVAELEGPIAELKTEMRKFEDTAAAELARLADETRRLMITMGFNLMIVHKDTNMSDFWADDFATADMPQEYANRLAADPRLTLVTHLVATLQQKITWQDRKVLLVGYLPESTQSHMRRRAPMGYNIEPGTVLLGYELGKGRKSGDTIRVLDKDLRVAGMFREKGSKEDITLAIHLKDAQEILNKPGRVNQIMALGCNCAAEDLPKIRAQLADVLPDTQITEFRSIAVARAEQREAVAEKQQVVLAQKKSNLVQSEKILADRREILAKMAANRARIEGTMETLAGVITPLVVLASAVWVGLLALSNVRERRTEIGLLRALGKGSATIGCLFLGKAFLLGLFGAAVGFVLGTWLAGWLGAAALDATTGQFQPRYDVLLWALLGAPLLSALASYLPTLTALLQDPAVVLREP